MEPDGSQNKAGEGTDVQRDLQNRIFKRLHLLRSDLERRAELESMQEDDEDGELEPESISSEARDGMHELGLLVEEVSKSLAELRAFGQKPTDENKPETSRSKGVHLQEAIRWFKCGADRYLRNKSIHDPFLSEQLIRQSLALSLAHLYEVQLAIRGPISRRYAAWRWAAGASEATVYPETVLQETWHLLWQAFLAWLTWSVVGPHSSFMGLVIVFLLIRVLVGRLMRLSANSRIESTVTTQRSAIIACQEALDDGVFDSMMIAERLGRVDGAFIFLDTRVFRLLRIRSQQRDRDGGCLVT